jgi:hypothetical protein
MIENNNKTELKKDFIIPSPFDRRVAQTVARAIRVTYKGK